MGRKKERKERDQRRQASSSASVSAAISASPCPPSGSTSASAATSASASASDTHPSANVASASTSHLSNKAQPEMQVTFPVQYLEPSLAISFEADSHSLAETAVENASAVGIEVFAELLETSGANLQAKPTYPTGFHNRKLEVGQWSQIGHDPFVAVSPLLESGIGLFQQRNEAKEELKKCQELNSNLVDKGLAALIKQPPLVEDVPGCPKCDLLAGVVRHMKEESEAYRVQMARKLDTMQAESTEMAKKYTQVQAESTGLKQQVSTLLNMVEDLRKVRRRNVIGKARKKAVVDIGKNLENVQSWNKFFTDNEQAVRDLGVSTNLLSLLRKGKQVLHKVVHEAPQANMADAILSLKEGSIERAQYEEAFKFAFDVDVRSFFPAVDDDDEV